jgi:hypothetical protein
VGTAARHFTTTELSIAVEVVGDVNTSASDDPEITGAGRVSDRVDAVLWDDPVGVLEPRPFVVGTVVIVQRLGARGDKDHGSNEHAQGD